TVNVTDYVGLDSVKAIYSMDGGGNWSTSLMSKASDVTNLTVAGYSYQYDFARITALKTVGSLVGTWDSSVSGYTGSPPAGFWTDNDVLFLDGDGYSYEYANAIIAARAGKMMVVNYDTWSSIRSSLSNPSYTSYVSNGFTTYGFNLGRGAVVMTYYGLSNRDNLGYSYNSLNATNKAKLAEHLLDCHKTFMPFSGQIPKTTTSMTVLYKINATDLSNLSTQSTTYEYTTDASPPSYLYWTPPPTPAAWDQSDSYYVYAKIKDAEGLGGVTLHYSLNGGATWSSRAMSFSSGNSTEANYTTTIPSTGSSSWVNYYYQAYDRSGNSARKPTSGVFSYQTSDAPSFASLTSHPVTGSLQSTVRVIATITDPDVVSLARAYYRLGSSGTWTVVNCTAGTNDRWY
ncbi:MAG: hypothetical protein KAQ96_06445, partial [Thermoplasmata archaeon]|nr:hypothetical protein [Thermoplasmata archaeon]